MRQRRGHSKKESLHEWVTRRVGTGSMWGLGFDPKWLLLHWAVTPADLTSSSRKLSRHQADFMRFVATA